MRLALASIAISLLFSGASAATLTPDTLGYCFKPSADGGVTCLDEEGLGPVPLAGNFADRPDLIGTPIKVTGAASLFGVGDNEKSVT